MLRPGVGPDGQGHGGAASGLADHESPAGEIAPHGAEAAAPVHVRATGLGVAGCRLGRRRRVAVGDHRGDRETDEEAGSRGARCRSEGREHTRADHRSKADDHRITRAKVPLERAGRLRVSHEPSPSWDARRCGLPANAIQAWRRRPGWASSCPGVRTARDRRAWRRNCRGTAVFRRDLPHWACSAQGLPRFVTDEHQP